MLSCFIDTRNHLIRFLMKSSKSNKQKKQSEQEIDSIIITIKEKIQENTEKT